MKKSVQEEKLLEAAILLKKIWVAFLVGLYAVSFITEMHFPGVQEEVAKGEEILMNVQRLFFFALLGFGFLVDLVQMRMDRTKAFLFLFLSLFLGGVADIVGTIQFKLWSGFFGA